MYLIVITCLIPQYKIVSLDWYTLRTHFKLDKTNINFKFIYAMHCCFYALKDNNYLERMYLSNHIKDSIWERQFQLFTLATGFTAKHSKISLFSDFKQDNGRSPINVLAYKFWLNDLPVYIRQVNSCLVTYLHPNIIGKFVSIYLHVNTNILTS